MHKSSSLEMPMSPQEIFKRYKRQILGMPEHPLFISKVSGHLSMCYIFIASYTMCYSWSVFIFVCCFLQFSFCFVCCNKWLDPIIRCLGGDTLCFNCIEHSSFHFYRSTSVLVCLYFVQLLFFTLIMSRDCLVLFIQVVLALLFLIKIILESCFK